jgi:hypothetical protein
MADDPATEQAKRTYATEKAALEKSQAQYASKMKGKPTPTQEENDLAACGAHILEHEADGSDLDPGGGPPTEKHLEAGHSPVGGGRPQAYGTRQSRASHE